MTGSAECLTMTLTGSADRMAPAAAGPAMERAASEGDMTVLTSPVRLLVEMAGAPLDWADCQWGGGDPEYVNRVRSVMKEADRSRQADSDPPDQAWPALLGCSRDSHGGRPFGRDEAKAGVAALRFVRHRLIARFLRSEASGASLSEGRQMHALLEDGERLQEAAQGWKLLTTASRALCDFDEADLVIQAQRQWQEAVQEAAAERALQAEPDFAAISDKLQAECEALESGLAGARAELDAKVRGATSEWSELQAAVDQGIEGIIRLERVSWKHCASISLACT